MKIALGTIEIDDDTRRLIAEHYGDEGLASRDRCRRFIVSNGTGALDDLRYSAQVADEDRDAR